MLLCFYRSYLLIPWISFTRRLTVFFFAIRFIDILFELVTTKFLKFANKVFFKVFSCLLQNVILIKIKAGLELTLKKLYRKKVDLPQVKFFFTFALRFLTSCDILKLGQRVFRRGSTVSL